MTVIRLIGGNNQERRDTGIAEFEPPAPVTYRLEALELAL